MEGINGQLHTKYQKIATEYSKIRAQASVLKKAVIEEQSRNAEIKEQLKEKEVELRRAEQELDSLTFRNQQLTKRVTVLQEELDQAQNKGKKGKNKQNENKAPLSPPPNHILDEEFQKKIVENAQLLSQIGDKDIEIEALNERIQHLEYKLDESEQSKIKLNSQYRDVIDKLERERNDLQRKLAEKQKHEETISWSSNEGKKDGYEYDVKSGVSNCRQLDPSPLSSPSASRKLSKTLGFARLQKPDEDDTGSEYELAKLCDLEKELHSWKAEYNLLQIKYNELCSKDNHQKPNLNDRDTFGPVETNNMVGKLIAPFSIPEEIEAREAKIRDYFIKEIDRLITEKHIYYAKTIDMAATNEVVNAHLDNSEAKREKCEAALFEALSSWTNLQEDKEVQEGSYKTQLSTMTEHLANMNEKLIQQTEEIQQLKFELANKNGKKGRQK